MIPADFRHWHHLYEYHVLKNDAKLIKKIGLSKWGVIITIDECGKYIYPLIITPHLAHYHLIMILYLRNLLTVFE